MWIAEDFDLPDIDQGSKSIIESQCPKLHNESFLEKFNLCISDRLVNFITSKNDILDLHCTKK